MSTGDTDSERGSLLIVDDEVGAIQLIRGALRAYSDVRFATHGKAALRIARERPPDLVLLDGEMPGESGFEVCQQMKADEALREVPVIFITAHDDIAFEQRALELGAADFLPKPISAPRVRLRVKLHLQLKQQIDELRALSMTDSLTQLANRRSLDTSLERELRRCHRSGLPLSVLMIDIDHFKRYNDSYGHAAGDACLRTVASVVGRAANRSSDVAGRMGGEEFLVILPEATEDGGRVVAERLLRDLASVGLPHRASDTAPYVTASIGLVCHPQARHVPRATAHPQVGAAQLVEAADRALYQAKRLGRNRVEIGCVDSVVGVARPG